MSKKSTNHNKNAIKTEITGSVVMCCALDMRTFVLIEGEGFKSLAQTFIKIGSKYGSIYVEDIVPTSTTVSNRLTKTYDMIKLKVRNEIFATDRKSNRS